MDSPHRPLAFNKMEALVQEMQDIENGVPVRSQKLFLTSIPSAFMGYDLIEWLMEHLDIEESVEAVHIANQLCQYGYFFPISDSRNLVVKDDSSLYRFQIPYYWPWQHRSPDNMEYAIYLAKRSLRNKQRHALEDYECDALNSLRKNLASKWDAITMHAEEQVRLAKDRKKGEKIVADSQERAYWRVHRPPPGYTSLLEPVPICRGRGGTSSKSRRSSTDLHREVQFLQCSLNRTRQKTSVALESLVQHCDLYHDYDPFLTGAQPCNPWNLQPSEEPAFWLYNSSLVDVPTEKRVKKWALSMEDLVCDETGLQEFTSYLKKEYNHENIKFWAAVKDLRGSSQSQIQQIVKQIYNEFLAAGAPCEINIDGKTMEKTLEEMKNPSRFAFDAAAEHVYTLLLKKDCYPRFIRSDHYKNVLSGAIQPSTKKRFFGFGGPAKKKGSSSATTTGAGLSTMTISGMTTMSSMSVGADQIGFGPPITMGGRRRGSDRSSTGSTTELVVAGIGTGAITMTTVAKSAMVPNSHSQSNLSEVPYRGDILSTDPAFWSKDDKGGVGTIEAGISIVDHKEKPESDNACPWDVTGPSQSVSTVQLQLQSTYKSEDHFCPWESSNLVRKHSAQLDVDSGSSSSDISLLVGGELFDRQRKPCTSLHGHTSTNANRLRRLSSTATTTDYQTTRGIAPSKSSRPSISSSSAEDIIATCTHHRSFDSNISPSAERNVEIQEETERITKAQEQNVQEVEQERLKQQILEQEHQDQQHLGQDQFEQQIRPKTQLQKHDIQLAPKPACSGSASSTNNQKNENDGNVSGIISDKSQNLRKASMVDLEQRPSCSKSTISHSKQPIGSCRLPSISVQPALYEEDIGAERETTEVEVEAMFTEQQQTEDKSQQPQRRDKKVKDKNLEKRDSDVCPWEDEESCKVDTPFVKTYATLGYL